jgi:hypothetical protein
MGKLTVKDILSKAEFQAHYMTDILKGVTPEAREVRKIFIKMIKSELKSAKRN